MPILTVRAEDETTEIFVVATDFALLGRGARRLEQDLRAGIYKVRAVSGRSEWQRVVVLRDDMVIEVPKIEFGSAAPLARTNRTHESHMAAAEQAIPPDQRGATSAPTGALSLGRGRQPSHDGSFVFMARWWTPWDDIGPKKLDDPSKGARLSTGGGRRLLSLSSSESEGRHVRSTDAGRYIAPEAAWFSGDLSKDRYAGVSLNAEPGIYTLGLSDGEGMTEQTVTILPGWRTHVFALYEPPVDDGGEAWYGPRKRLVDVSIHIARGSLSMEDDLVRLTDAARLSLADERSVATNELLKFVRGKFENPMLGLYGAHLLLLLRKKASAASIERPVEYNGSLFQEVVGNTAQLFGNDHPDIIALREIEAEAKPLTGLPMLSHSWARLLSASADAPKLIPPSLWRRTAFRSRTQPFFTWRVPQYGGDRIMYREVELIRAILDAATEWEFYNKEATGLRDRRATAAVRDDFVRDCIERFEAPRSVIDMVL
ncbi:hypothetical protein SAMN05444358_1181 [Ruegeria halocynthiae]|uniref:Uncharacterized protein n=1 Tax=Ruegeria halocynthiae TaxID=985054 RepID=A0A1H3FUQ5_9RHOB|nr:hypothetical protein [Ruegeria halocynthiae]SDX93884.1 hypothetical protein SAMN05444358_1181 [Ruegeria halocynthiae]